VTRRADEGRGGIPQECLIRLDRVTGRELYAVQKCAAPYLADPETRSKIVRATEPSSTAAPAAATGQMASGSFRIREPSPGDPDYVPGGQPAREPAGNDTPSVQLVGRSAPKDLQLFCGARLAACGDRLFNCMGSELVATDRATGKRRWGVALEDQGAEGSLAEPVGVPPAIANGKLFVASRDGHLLCIDWASGRVIGRAQLGAPAASQPIIEGGRVFVGTTTGELVTIKTADPKLTGWNQWGGDASHSGVVGVLPVATRRVASEGPTGLLGLVSHTAGMKTTLLFVSAP